MTDDIDAWTAGVHEGDCRDVLADLPAESVHACVTDPPYGLAFMGRDWDDFEPREYQQWCEEWARDVKRVLKPGAHLLAFSGNRTHHRLFSGVEDAGFEIRDTITWHYGSGFPKALDVSKAIDKQRDDEEEMRVVCRWLRDKINQSDYTVSDIANHFGHHSRMVDHWAARDTDSQPSTPTWEQWLELKGLLDLPDEMDDLVNWLNERKGEPADSWDEREVIRTLEDHGDRTVDILQGSDGEYQITKPATDAAERWAGFKTALKPATEYIVMARKPFAGTVAENVQEHGTGALNIDGTRVGSGVDTRRPTGDQSETQDKYGHMDGGITAGDETSGRYPSNVVFDETQAAALDREVGELDAGAHTTGGVNTNVYGRRERTDDPDERTETDSGGPSRYFYTSKASRAERTLDGKIDNAHPTVKPADLMEWLVTLVTAEGQTVLDPFAGSGTTCRAAKDLGRRFVGIERQAQWADVARVRCGLAPEDPNHVRADGPQAGLEAFTEGHDD